MFLERGFQFTHEAVREWEERFAPMITDLLRKRRRHQAGPSWYVDETYIKVSGKWCYLYRAIDRDGNLIDCRLSQKRDRQAAKAFFRQALKSTGCKPQRVTTDGHLPYVRVIKDVMGERTLHRTNTYLNNRIEQDHRGIKSRYGPMKGFKSFTSASRFCGAFDEFGTSIDLNRPAMKRSHFLTTDQFTGRKRTIRLTPWAYNQDLD
jgi:transposase-like protein